MDLQVAHIVCVLAFCSDFGASCFTINPSLVNCDTGKLSVQPKYMPMVMALQPVLGEYSPSSPLVGQKLCEKQSSVVFILL